MKLRRRVRFLRRLLMFLSVLCLVGCGPVGENIVPVQEVVVSQEPEVIPEIPDFAVEIPEEDPRSILTSRSPNMVESMLLS